MPIRVVEGLGGIASGNETDRFPKVEARTDIFVELGSRPERPEYVFEAKRLRTNGYGVGKYIGLV